MAQSSRLQAPAFCSRDQAIVQPETVQKSIIMRHHQQAALVAAQHRFKCLGGRQVQMIVGLIEQ